MPTPIVEVKKATKVYRQGAVEVNALRGLDLTIQQGEFTAIYGPSGSGKSTLLNLIGALDSPTSGEVRLEGRDLGQMSRWQRSAMRRDRIGFVFQAYNLIPVLTAFENAEAVAALKGGDAAERRAKVLKLLDEVGLEGMADRRPFELSGGQQQRVAIVRAIASEPAIVLADEPTANVDSETSEKLLQLMEELNENHGVTFLFSTHDPAVMDRAHRLVKLVDGRVAEDTVREAVA
ncbi:MAG: ABC transporter ATP-binding protein [Myxococcota bacterium]